MRIKYCLKLRGLHEDGIKTLCSNDSMHLFSISPHSRIIDFLKTEISYLRLIGLGRIFPDGSLIRGTIANVEWEWWYYYCYYCSVDSAYINEHFKQWMENTLRSMTSSDSADSKQLKRRLEVIEQAIKSKETVLIDIRDHKMSHIYFWGFLSSTSVLLVTVSGIILGRTEPSTLKSGGALLGAGTGGLMGMYSLYKLCNTALLTKARCNRALDRLNIMRSVLESIHCHSYQEVVNNKIQQG